MISCFQHLTENPKGYEQASKQLSTSEWDDFFKKENIIVFEQVDYEPLYNVIQRLTPKYRMVLDLYYFQELSVKEISQVLHASQSKIKTNLMRGRRLVRGILEKEGYNYEDFK